METNEQILCRLKKSTFRARFHLSKKDVDYIKARGMDTIQSHARDFVEKRLSPMVIPNDGKQTPMHGHPVFIAQHATACCCRGCLNKWHHIPMNTELTKVQQEWIVNLLMDWIDEQLKVEGKEKYDG